MINQKIEKKEEQHYVASQWSLMWKKFRDHKIANIAALLVILLYLVAIFVEFVAPYNPHETNSELQYAPPQKVNFVDEEGFHLRPFIFGYQRKFDPQTFQQIYTLEKNNKLPIYFLVRGHEYKLWGFFKSNLHLFGTKTGEKIFIFGTDSMGRDIFSRTIYGVRISMTIGLIGVLLSLFLGIILGGISAYYGGIIDMMIQRFIELLRSFPTIPLWMSLAAALPSDWSPVQVYFGITVILSLRGWTGIGRVVRGKFLSLKSEDFVLAAELVGASTTRIIGRHMLPSFISHLIATISLSIPGMILAETSLSFLGIGLRPPVVSWGVLLKSAQKIHTVVLAPWLMIPGFFVIITVLAFNFMGDGLRDAADPYSE